MFKPAKSNYFMYGYKTPTNMLAMSYIYNGTCWDFLSLFKLKFLYNLAFKNDSSEEIQIIQSRLKSGNLSSKMFLFEILKWQKVPHQDKKI